MPTPLQAIMKKKVGDRGSDVAHLDSKAVLTFARNFTVYVLPPDTVCLYSEHRKFFLHGELYCALASAVRAGKSLQAIFRALERNFPPDKIEEALQRLVGRRFLVPKASTLDVAAAYWASLGLSPEIAVENLQGHRVRIQSINVQGAAELGAALRELGVRVVKRDADLIVTLVSDYLEERLDRKNRQHLTDETRWLLFQPSGIFPLVGPVFSPGKGACWTCLTDRMKRNREVRAFLDRKQARSVSTSPLVSGMFGQNAIQLAAVEIAKAIASGFRTDLNDHIISLDLLGSTLVRHYVAARPQCPTCGSPELRDPSRAPLPVEPKGNGKLVMTSGGYRSVSPFATISRFRKHVSPLTGVVSRLERIASELPLNTSYIATHNFSPLPETVEELKSGLSGDSYGKGSTAEQGEASALMEAIERYSGIFQGDEIRIVRRFTDFPAGDAIAPNDVSLFSDAQYRNAATACATCEDATSLPPLFDRSAEIEWTPVWSLRDKRFKYLPTGLCYYFHNCPGADEINADSNGCAAGNTLEEAIVQGFLELVERDSYAIWWYNKLKRAEVDLNEFDDSYIRDLQKELNEAGCRTWMLDVTNDLGIPSYVAISHWMEDAQEQIEFGSGAHFDTRIAALRALTELNQFMSIRLIGNRGSDQDGSDPLPLKDHPYLTPMGGRALRPDFRAEFNRLDAREQVMACVRIAERENLDFLVLDQTRPDIGVPVARVIVPGLRHFYRRFAPGRLYDIPIKLGWLDRATPENELNPLLPPT